MKGNTEQKVEQYLLGNMDQREQRDFQEQLESNPDLQKELNQQSLIIKGIESHNRKDLRQQLTAIHESMNASQQPALSPTIGKRRRLSWLAAAASILLLLFAISWLYSDSSSPDQLYSQYFEVYELNLSQRSESDSQLVQLESLYRSRDYQATLPLFESLLQSSAETSKLHLCAGIAQLELGQSSQALNHFDAIIQSKDFMYEDIAKWYIALAHLKMDQPQKAKLYLQTLANDAEADRHQQAKELLEKL